MQAVLTEHMGRNPRLKTEAEPTEEQLALVELQQQVAEVCLQRLPHQANG